MSCQICFTNWNNLLTVIRFWYQDYVCDLSRISRSRVLFFAVLSTIITIWNLFLLWKDFSMHDAISNCLCLHTSIAVYTINHSKKWQIPRSNSGSHSARPGQKLQSLKQHMHGSVCLHWWIILDPIAFFWPSPHAASAVFVFVFMQGLVNG